MRRVVLDPGVLVSALISPSGTPARLLRAIHAGDFELVISAHLLAELEGVLRRDKFRRHFDPPTVDAYLDLLRRDASLATDPGAPPSLRSADPDDDYLIALAQAQNAILVSGDKHLLDLSGGGAPIFSPADLLAAGS